MDFFSDSDSDEVILAAARAVVAVTTAVVSELEQQKVSARIAREYIRRDRETANANLMRDYFSEAPLYRDEQFKRRYRMSRELFTKIVNDMEHNFRYFQQKTDATGAQGFSAYQKCTSAVRQMAFGVTGELFDDYLKMSEKVSRDSLYYFCRGVNKLYGYRYLRKPTWSDVQQIYSVHEEVHGFTGMLGSIDCTHWEWENCPVAWRGAHQRGDHPHPTIMLEAVASYDLWIWHAFFGVAGGCNDINVLDQSPIFDDVYKGVAPTSGFYVNDSFYKHGYYLADGIYPEYATFVKNFTCPSDEKRLNFKKAQEAARKDVERAFGILKKKWHIISNPCRMWKKDKIREAMYACIVLHNMILEDKGKAICQNYEDVDVPESTLTPDERSAIRAEVRDRETHHMLKGDLVEYLWSNRPRD